MNKNLSYIETKYYITSTTDKKGVITAVSEAFCQLSGYSQEELIGQKHSIVRHPDTPDSVFADLWNTITSGNVWTGIIKNKAKDGSHYWVDSSIEPIFDDKGNILGYLSVRFDITSQYDLMNANNKLENTIRRFQKLFENVNSGIAIIDNNGKFVDVNPYLCKLFEYTKEEYMLMNCQDTSQLKDSQDIKKIINDILENNLNEKIIQKKCQSKSGKDIWVETTYSYFEKNLILVSIKNIEDLKKLEHTTNLLISQSRDAAMGEMLSMIAHQWRQPLATLSTITSKMKIKQELDMYSKEAFEIDYKKISSIIMHLSKTIEYFRNYFKPKQISKEKISHIYKNLNVILEPLCEKNSIEFICDFHDNNIKVDNRIDQVLLNIYKNAIDACYEKNKQGKIITNTTHLNNYLFINIIDNAGGIDNEIIEKIFEPYFSTKNKNGTGLGLYMSKNIIENDLSGKLSVRNINNGACFTIKILITTEDN